jgi:hypothetical protein
MLTHIPDAHGILDIQCNVGGAAIAAIKRGIPWFGLEGNKRMRDNLPRHCMQMLAKVARQYGYFKHWAKNKHKYCLIFVVVLA